MITTSSAPRAVRTSALDRGTAMRLAEDEYRRHLEQLRDLEPADWARPTDCPAWDVRAVAAHCLGMAEMAASLRESRRQNRAAADRGGVFIDALTALQVEERASMSPRQILDRYAVAGRRAVRGRRRTPWFVRRRPLPVPQRVNGAAERWSIGFLVDTILTRDVWMHRIDTARATGRSPVLTADHDGLLVADVAAEWAQRHGAPCTLSLTGPAGGRWAFGTGGPAIELDAVEFCRVLSGRPPASPGVAHELLTVEVPF